MPTKLDYYDNAYIYPEAPLVYHDCHFEDGYISSSLFSAIGTYCLFGYRFYQWYVK